MAISNVYMTVVASMTIFHVNMTVWGGGGGSMTISHVYMTVWASKTIFNVEMIVGTCMAISDVDMTVEGGPP